MASTHTAVVSQEAAVPISPQILFLTDITYTSTQSTYSF
uniref:Uncharacterized protein n=1 Tax=Anguilla anguilla TaxID=7936 RepID=A0A0E9XKS3_ANGAN